MIDKTKHDRLVESAADGDGDPRAGLHLDGYVDGGHDVYCGGDDKEMGQRQQSVTLSKRLHLLQQSGHDCDCAPAEAGFYGSVLLSNSI